MGANTKIEWADHTWNPWWGCTKVSVGEKGACENCYAEILGHRFGVAWGNAPRKLASPAHWRLPAKWNLAASRAGTRPLIFCSSMADIFDNQVDPLWRRWAFEIMRLSPQLIFLLLTKRPSMIERLALEAGGLPPNAAIGASIVTQAEVVRDVPHLSRAAAALKPAFSFLSAEPLMEELDLGFLHRYGSPPLIHPTHIGSVNWVIAGGESGPHARPSHPDWFRSLRDQCAAAGVPFLFKQWGEWWPSNYATGAQLNVAARIQRGPEAKALWQSMSDQSTAGCLVEDQRQPPWAMMRVGKANAGRSLDGREHNEFPIPRKKVAA